MAEQIFVSELMNLDMSSMSDIYKNIGRPTLEELIDRSISDNLNYNLAENEDYIYNETNSQTNQWTNTYNGMTSETDANAGASTDFLVKYQSITESTEPFRYTPMEEINNLYDYDRGFNYNNDRNQEHNNQYNTCPQMNGFGPINHSFIQNSSQTFGQPMVECPPQPFYPPVNPNLPDITPTNELPEPVLQLNGHLITVKEFNEETQLELSCEEQIDDNSVDSISINGDNPVNHYSPLPEPELPLKSFALKTYTRVPRVPREIPKIRRRPQLDPTAISTATTLMLLSKPNAMKTDKRRELRPKMQRGQWAQLDYAERTRIKRERNRVAAKKCRQRKLDKIKDLEHKKGLLMEDNQKCEHMLKKQRHRLLDLQMSILRHRASDDCKLNRI